MINTNKPELVTDYETIHALHVYAHSFTANHEAFMYAKVYAQYLTLRKSDWNFDNYRTSLSAKQAAAIRQHMDEMVSPDCPCGEAKSWTCKHGACKGCGDCVECETTDRQAEQFIDRETL